MIRPLAFAAALLASASSAAAAEQAPVQWTGFHLGAQGGWAQRSGPAGFDPPFGAVARAGRGERRGGLDGQAFVGYDIKGPGRLIIGAEAMAGIGGETRDNLNNGRSNGTSEPRWNYAVSARIGAPVGRKGLAYLRAGYAAERVHKTYFGPLIRIFPPPPTEGTSWADGALIGIGGELSVHKHLSLRLEYDHRRLDGGYRGDAVLLGGLWRF